VTPSPLWLLLLRHRWCVGRQALTLPFLIGAFSETNPRYPISQTNSSTAILDLLKAFRDQTPTPELIRISECDNLRQPVATVITEVHYYPAPADLKFVSPVTGHLRLIVEPRYGGKIALTLANIAENLWRRCSDSLSTSKFSFRNHAFEVFDNTDRSYISAAQSCERCNDL
jgi:hypothetical protein